MNNILTKYAFVALAFAICLSSNVFARVRVFAHVDSSKDIYIGESFSYYIVLEGADTVGQVDLTPLQKYNPQSTGSRKQSSIKIINNRTAQSVSTIMTYSLSVQQAGWVQIPPVTVTIDGKSYRTNPVKVNILKPGTTDRLDLDVTLSEQQCYVGQPVIMTVKFYISADIGNFQFNIPVFNSDAFYIEEPDVSDRQAKKYRLGMGVSVWASQYRVRHNGRNSILLSFSKVLIPKRSGRIEISPASVSADVAVGRVRSQGLFDDSFFDGFFGSQKQYKRFMVTSKPLNLTVLALPEKGKPTGFYGLVGRYTISASAKPTTDVYMGDPITLTIKVGGSKYLKPVQWPQLEQVPELAANFKIPSQKAPAIVKDGFKVFTQTIRPDNNQANVIPSIPLAYFNPDTGSYSVAKTRPIKLDLKPSRRLGAADMEGKDFVPLNKEVEAIKKGLSANYEGPEVLENMSFSPLAAAFSPGYATLWAVPLGVLILSLFVKFLTSTSPEKIAAKRRRQACRKAVTQLKKVTSIDTKRRNELIASIMKQYIGARFDKTAGSLTADDCCNTIISATQDTEIAVKYRQIIERCEAARYASIDVSIDSEEIRDIIELVCNVEKKSRK